MASDFTVALTIASIPSLFDSISSPTMPMSMLVQGTAARQGDRPNVEVD